MFIFLRRAIRFIIVVSAALAAVPQTAAQDFSGTSSPSAADYCYLVADNGDIQADADVFTRVYKPNGVEEQVAATGTLSVEAIAFFPLEPVLYAVDGNVFGMIDLDTGVFSGMGTLPNAQGTEGTLEVADVDGLSFDPRNGLLYATVRREANDALIQIDPTTARVVTGAFGVGRDYVPVQLGEVPIYVDDIAIHPVTGIMYALISEGGARTVLATVDRFTGKATLKIDFGTADYEGLSFDHDGRLYAAGGHTGNIVRINTDTAKVSNFTTLGVFGNRDYESITCMAYGTAGIGTAVDPFLEVPVTTALEQNFPNPFNPQTVFGFSMARTGNVRLSVYDMLGREVAVALEAMVSAGRHEVVFTAAGLPSGLYLYRLSTPERAFARSMTLLR